MKSCFDESQGLGTLLVTAFFALVILFVAQRAGFFRIHPASARERHLPLAVAFGAFLVFGIVNYLLYPLVIVYLFHWSAQTTPPWVWHTGNLVILAIDLLCLLLYCRMLNKQTQRVIFGTKKGSGGSFGIGVIGCLLAYPLVVLTGALFNILLCLFGLDITNEQVAVVHFKATFDRPWLLMGTALFMAVIVPFIEELLFRGFLQNWLRGLMGFKKAIVVTALIFAALHFSAAQAWTNPPLIASLFVLSCFLGFVYEREKKLWAPFALHMTFNAVNITMIFFTK